MATPEGRTKDGFETQFGTNHLGHFLLFQLLKPLLLKSATPEFPSRVVSLTSIGHRFGPIRFDDVNFEKESYDEWKAYGQSKTANIYLANEIERRYGAKGLHATSVHPGGIQTGLMVHLEPEALESWAKNPVLVNYMKSVEQGAATSVYAAIGKEWANKGGKYLANCAEQGPVRADLPLNTDPNELGDGYSAWAYDEVAEGMLWKESLKMVGLTEDGN